MSCQNEELRRELLTKVARDLQVREDLVGRGVLYDGYHPEIEAVHAQNAMRLEEILSEHIIQMQTDVTGRWAVSEGDVCFSAH